MTQQDFELFKKMMKQAESMTIMPNGKDIDCVTFALFEGLKQYDIEDVRRAVVEHCRTEKFFPMLADIIKRIDGDTDSKAASAWALVLKTISRHGHTDSVKFPHPAIHYAIQQMGGWRYLCETLTNDAVPFRAKDFAGYYTTGERIADWTEASGKTKVPAYLIGAHEANNGKRGLAYTVTVWDAETGKPLESCKPAELPSGKPHDGEVYDVSKLISAMTGRMSF